MVLTEEQKERLGIVDERVDYYFKVENTVIDGFKVKDQETGKEVTEMAFDNIYQAHLFVVLSRYCNNGQIAYPSVSTLCKKCYCSKPTLLKAMEALEKKGYIAKVKRYNSETKINDTSVYVVKNINVPVVKEIDKGSKGDLLGVVKEIDKGSKGDLPKEELLKNNKLRKTTTKEPEKSSSSLEIYLKEKGYDSKTISNISKLDVTLERVKEVITHADKKNMGIGYIVDALKNGYEIPKEKQQPKKELSGRRSSAVLGEKDLECSMSSEEREHKRLESEVYKIIKKEDTTLRNEFFKAAGTLKTLKEFIEKQNLKVS